MSLSINMASDGKLIVKDIGDPLALYLGLRDFFAQRRPTRMGAHGRIIPETTNAEVRQIADLWHRVFQRVWRRDLARADQHRQEWQDTRSQIDAATAAGIADAAFPRNDDLWTRWLRRSAFYLSAVKDRPSKYDEVIDSLRQAVVDLPDNVAAGARATAGAAESAAKQVGKMVSRFRTPLLIIAGVAVTAAIALPVARRLGSRASSGGSS